MARSSAGLRVRELRRQAGLTQKALAQSVGISPSYLNLIEHNQRAVTAAMAPKLASALGTSTETLSDHVDNHLVDTLTAALADIPGDLSQAARADLLVGRFPDWAKVLDYYLRRNKDLEDALTALSDRMTHDPFLSQTLHGMLSNITAIRASAEILYQVRDLGPEQDHRFRRSLYEESGRVADMSRQLANYLGEGGELSSDPATPEEALEAMLQKHDWTFDALDTLAAALTHPDSAAAKDHFSGAITELLLDSGLDLRSDGAKLAQSWLEQYAQDAVAMPLLRFHKAATENHWDPLVLAQLFGQSIHGVMRRLASLNRPRLAAPPMGMVLVNAAGHPLYRRPLPGFALPRHGNFCTLWPLFEAFSRPGQLTLGTISLKPDDPFQTIAIALPRTARDLNTPQDHLAAMLFSPQEEQTFQAAFPPAARLVGASCRVCPHQECSARTSPNVLV
ncbi:MAG: short-chain fatty acyl-CoA regulator family protein [Pseudomonadota bacterium]